MKRREPSAKIEIHSVAESSISELLIRYCVKAIKLDTNTQDSFRVDCAWVQYAKGFNGINNWQYCRLKDASTARYMLLLKHAPDLLKKCPLTVPRKKSDNIMWWSRMPQIILKSKFKLAVRKNASRLLAHGTPSFVYMGFVTNGDTAPAKLLQQLDAAMALAAKTS
ncbi:hypothetical protein BPOR_0630g00100 [Botrytis porri]|uniref:Uncharacterized protein n=1 Tax=Botrytis porri TaxID=87229 RepID=A0A4Z1KBI9_9HELO|nr:hypothetical protein BPOR_0630g00100 [Botrytis porri]